MPFELSESKFYILVLLGNPNFIHRKLLYRFL
jgi:hypothetical protein